MHGPIDRGVKTGARGHTPPGPSRSVASPDDRPGRARGPVPHPRHRSNGRRRHGRNAEPCRPASATRCSGRHRRTSRSPRPSRAHARRSRPIRRRGTPPAGSSTSGGSTGRWLAPPPVDPSGAPPSHRECSRGRAPSSFRPRTRAGTRRPWFRRWRIVRASALPRRCSPPVAGSSREPMTGASHPHRPRTGSASGSFLRSRSELPTAAGVGHVARVSQARSLGIPLRPCHVSVLLPTGFAHRKACARRRHDGRPLHRHGVAGSSRWKGVAPTHGASPEFLQIGGSRGAAYASIYVRSCRNRL